MASDETDPSMEKENPVSDGEGAGAAVSSWLSGWYDTAKKKLAETNEFMKHDLQEFSQAVQQDASKLVAATATTMKEKLNINVDLEEASAATRVVKDSFSSFLGNIASKVGPIRPDDEENADETAIVGTASGAKVLSPSEARLYAIRTDPATFCNEPDNEEEFSAWLPSFNIEEKGTEVSSLMLDCSQIRSLYTKLVPSAISHSDFWARYFFKLHTHEKAEERRAALVERAHKTHDDIEWDDEDDDWVQPKNIPKEVTPEGIDKRAQLGKEALAEPENGEARRIEEDPKKEIESAKPAASDATETETKTHKPGKEDTENSSEERVETEPEKPATTESAEKSPETGIKDNAQTNSQDTVEAEATSDDAKKTSTGKLPSSEESSDDWEKDFDLDMTEDEIQQALKESDAVDIDDIGEDWDEWE